MYVVRGESRSQETSHYYACNWGTMVDVEGKGGYRSHTRHYSSHNQVEHGRLLTSSENTFGVDGRVGYMSQTSHSYYQRVDSKGDGERPGSRHEYINQYSLLKFIESVYGDGISGYRSPTSPSPSYF